jgi:hypothetical protein
MFALPRTWRAQRRLWCWLLENAWSSLALLWLTLTGWSYWAHSH